jgi:hypothetical protein
MNEAATFLPISDDGSGRPTGITDAATPSVDRPVGSDSLLEVARAGC